MVPTLLHYKHNLKTGDNMQFRNGDLCRVVSNRSHRDPHTGDLVLITREKLNPKILVVYYVEGFNLTRQSRFHYKVDELEKVEEKCSKSETS